MLTSLAHAMQLVCTNVTSLGITDYYLTEDIGLDFSLSEAACQICTYVVRSRRQKNIKPRLVISNKSLLFRVILSIVPHTTLITT